MEIIHGKKVEENQGPPPPIGQDAAKVEVRCPTCQQTYPVDRSLLGRNAICKKCETTFLISLPQAPPPLPGPPPSVSPPQTPSAFSGAPDVHRGGASADVKDSAGKIASSFGGSVKSGWQRSVAALRQGWRRMGAFLKAASQRGGPIVARGLAASATAAGPMVRFYWVHRGNLFRLLLTYLPRVRDYAWQRRQIAVSVWNEYSNAEWDGSHWDIRLPDRCVVCGQTGDLAQRAELTHAADLFWPLWLTLCGTIAAVAVGLLWRAWFVPIPILIGLAIGYFTSAKKEVQIRFARCPKHLNNERYPRLFASGSWLCVHVGHSSVKSRFLAESGSAVRLIAAHSEGSGTGAAGAVTLSPYQQPAPSVVPLDESPIVISWDDPEQGAPDSTFLAKSPPTGDNAPASPEIYGVQSWPPPPESGGRR